jgi:gas vesicle protein
MDIKGANTKGAIAMANGVGKFLGGFLIGTAVGGALGLLLSPKSGKETRRLLRKSADALPDLANDFASEVGSNMQIQADRLSEQAGRTLEETMVRLQEAIAIGKEASQKLRQELNPSNPQIFLDDEDLL